MSNSSRVTRRMGLRTAVAATVALPLLTTAQASVTRRANRPLDVNDLQSALCEHHRTRQLGGTPSGDAPAVTRRGARRHRHQEGLYPQLLGIESDLGPHYEWIGTGREGGSHDESVAIFYDTRRLAPVEHDTFWLSDTPRVIGSNTWGRPASPRRHLGAFP